MTCRPFRELRTPSVCRSHLSKNNTIHGLRDGSALLKTMTYVTQHGGRITLYCTAHTHQSQVDSSVEKMCMQGNEGIILDKIL